MVVQTKIKGRRSPIERRTQVERRTSAKNALLRAAAELVAEQGVRQSSLAEIGERAGYSRGLVNRHFGTKEALMEELAVRCQSTFTEGMTALSDISGREQVLRIAHLYLTAFIVPTPFAKAFLVMWGEAFPTAALKKVIQEADERAGMRIAETVKVGIADGSIRPDVDPDVFAAAMLGMLRGVAALSLVSSRKMHRTHRQCLDFVDAALRNQP